MTKMMWLCVAVGLVLAPGAGMVQGQDGPVVTADTLHPDDGKLRIIQFGAHPDDCEIRAGGVGAMWAELGHHVQFVSVTNGDIGHWQMSGGALAKRRTAEVKAAAEALGVERSTVLDIHDGELMPTLENRRLLTRLMREWDADIVIGHRPNDYHPDHRYVGVLMQDAAYMVAVPFFCPDTPPLRGNPVFLYSSDRFQRPTPFEPDIVVAIDSVIEKKAEAMSKIESQFIEGGCMGYRRGMPKDEAERESRRQGVRESAKRRSAGTANRYRDKLIELYGEEKGKQVKYAEAFMVCEYGSRPSAEQLKRLFPFFE
ncbi:MAG: PIG-L deacetylase family protein [Armatimonadota bacterium]